ncbi:MAG: hypothetical protein A2Z16_16265 [Chloroflexi bacterium RBG_16_54_18]|nr:MAG: hypothetical protein A2Z16_16265 [Chloroflexi bacterium RBG_16_54_18]
MKGVPAKQAYDVIIIGAGHNGLVAAAYLARAHLRVLVLERREVLGGAAATEAIFPGYRVDTGSFSAGSFLPRLVQELNLAQHSLEFLEGPAWAHALQLDGRGLTFWRDVSRSQAEIEQFSPKDAAKYPAYLEELRRHARLLQATWTMIPPHIPETRWSELLSWTPIGWQLRRQGKRAMMEFTRALPMPAADYLDERFESQALKGALASASAFGGLLSPGAAGTALMLFYQAIGAGPGAAWALRSVRGGTGRLSEALAKAAQAHGAEVCLESGVRRVWLQDGRAAGVSLESGEQLSARVVVSNAGPGQTFFGLVGAEHLPVRFVRELKNIKYRGGAGRVALALADLPDFPGVSGAGKEERLSGRILLAPGLEYLEKAADAAKFGRLPDNLPLEAAIPTILDASLAPPGRHLMLVNVQYTPYRLVEGDWEARRDELGRRVVETLETYAPGFSRLVLDWRAWTPLDMERIFGLTEGSHSHGEMGLDQLLFMRPVPGYGQYRTPIHGLYLCSAGTHPGGGVTGAPGYNATRAVLQDLSRQTGVVPGRPD